MLRSPSALSEATEGFNSHDLIQKLVTDGGFSAFKEESPQKYERNFHTENLEHIRRTEQSARSSRRNIQQNTKFTPSKKARRSLPSTTCFQFTSDVSLTKTTTASTVGRCKRQGIDYVSANKKVAKKEKRSAKTKRNEATVKLATAKATVGYRRRHGEFGHVPAYLKQRKDEWRKTEEEKQRQIELAKIPGGMKPISETQRIATLEKLNATRESIVSEISKLPLRLTTIRMRKAEADLRTSLEQTLEGIRVFSHSTVFVPIDYEL